MPRIPPESRLRAMGYTYSHGHKRWRVYRDLRQDSPLDLAPDLHGDDREETPEPGSSSCGWSGPATLGDFIAVEALPAGDLLPAYCPQIGPAGSPLRSHAYCLQMRALVFLLSSPKP